MSKSKLGLCSLCNKTKNGRKRQSLEGAFACDRCYRDKLQPQRTCIMCGKLSGTDKFDENGNSICKKCNMESYITPIEECYKCHEMKPTYTRNELYFAICKKCYHNNYIPPAEECCECHKINPVHCRSEFNLPICKKCYNEIYETPVEKCVICHEYRNVCVRLDDGNAICERCNIIHKRNTNEHFRLMEKFRIRLCNILKKYTETGKIKHAIEYGIDFEAIIKYLGPCPGDREDYHIDHIFPLSAFDFNNPIQIKASFAPENHQWLLAKENLSKGTKYNKEEFQKYLEKFYEKTK